MGFNVAGEKVMIFRKEYNDRAFYNAGLSKKMQDGSYQNGYISIVFKKGVDIPNKTKINVREGFITFYLKDKTTIPQIFVLEYDVLEQSSEGFAEVETDDDLPF